MMEDCSTDERLQQETLCHRQWSVDRRVRRTSRDVDEAERVVVVWLQCLLVNVDHHACTLAPDHVEVEEDTERLQMTSNISDGT